MELSPLTAEILNVIVPALLSALAVCLTAAAGYAANWARARTKSLKGRNAIDVFQAIVLDAVAEAENTTVVGFKRAAADGKLTPENARTVRNAVVNVIKRHLGARGMAELSKLWGTVDDGRIRTAIEATLHGRKTG